MLERIYDNTRWGTTESEEPGVRGPYSLTPLPLSAVQGLRCHFARFYRGFRVSIMEGPLICHQNKEDIFKIPCHFNNVGTFECGRRVVVFNLLAMWKLRESADKTTKTLLTPFSTGTHYYAEFFFFFFFF